MIELRGKAVADAHKAILQEKVERQVMICTSVKKHFSSRQPIWRRYWPWGG